jgi:hypothetical protein
MSYCGMCRYQNCAFPMCCNCKCHQNEHKTYKQKWTCNQCFGSIDDDNTYTILAFDGKRFCGSACLDVYYPPLEKEFTTIREQVKYKTEQAVRLLEEALENSKKQCFAFECELYAPIDNLKTLVKDYFDKEPSGWDTSGCFY